MKFHDPQWLWAILAAPLFATLAWIGVNRQREAIERFASKLTVGRLINEKTFRRKKITAITLGVAVALLAIAVARPQYGVKPVMVKRTGIDVMIAVDTSKSMNARDIKPSRMERARNEIKKLIPGLAGNRVGLISFAGRSFVECPLTLDISTVNLFLDTVTVGSIPAQGTAIGAAIDDTVRAFEVSKAKTKAMILITDGENLDGDFLSAAKRAKEKGIIIFPIGIGSSAGAPIPELDNAGNITGYKVDENGETVVTRLDTDSLIKIAEATGGFLVESSGEGLDIGELVKHLMEMEKTDITSQEFTEYEERYQWLAALALLLLMVEYLLVGRVGKGAG